MAWDNGNPDEPVRDRSCISIRLYVAVARAFITSLRKFAVWLRNGLRTSGFMNSMPRPTITDLAAAAGVSLATVDRVLNARTGVRQATVDRVNQAIKRIGYFRDPFAANLARRRDFCVQAFVPAGDGQFATELRHAVGKTAGALASDRVDLELTPFPAEDPYTLASLLDSVPAEGVDGLVIMAPETPQLRDAVRRLAQRGVPTAAVISDLPNSSCEFFIGINNIAAGRTAGSLMGKFIGGGAAKVAVMTSSLQARDSLDRRLGFDQALAEAFPGIEVLPTIEGHDNPQAYAGALNRVLATHTDLRGVYSMGGGNRVLMDLLALTDPARRIHVIAHELTPTTRDGLRADRLDAVITQDLGHILRSAIRKLRAMRDSRPIVEEQERIRIEILVKDNLS